MKEQKKKISELLLAAGIILPAAFFFSVTADLPHVLLIVMFGLLLTLFIRKPFILNDRSVIYCTIIVLTTTVLTDYVFPLEDNRFGYLSIFFYPEFLVPGALYLALGVTFFRSGPQIYGAAAAAALLALSFGGDIYVMRSANERLPFAAPLIDHFPQFYVITIAVVFSFILPALRHAGSPKLIRRFLKLNRRRVFLYAIFFLLVPLGSLGVYQLYRTYESHIRKLENMFMRGGARYLRRNRNIVFGREIDLNRTLDPELVQNQQQIVLRAIAKKPPGYLRGHAYTNYQSGHWTAPHAEETKTMKLRSYAGVIAYNTFFFEQPEKQPEACEILPSERLFNKTLFIPGNTGQIDTIAKSIDYTTDGVLEVNDWTPDGGYTVFTPAVWRNNAWQQPNPPSKIYLATPSEIDNALDEILASIPKLRTPDLTDTQRFVILLNYFNKIFTYSVQQHNFRGLDPIIYFMTIARQGHCELFASALILLLRRLDIPARYVTGFICSEQHPAGHYYVARLGNAHAWVEAYNRQKQRWELLEPTPPSGTPNYQHQWTMLESWKDLISKTLRQLLSDMRRGLFARVIINAAENIYLFLKMLLWNPWRGPLFLLLMGWLLKRRVERLRRANRRFIAQFSRPDTARLQLSKAYHKLLRSLRKYPEITITAATTVGELATMIQAAETVPDERKKQLLHRLKQFEDMRYHVMPPSPEQLREFLHN